MMMAAALAPAPSLTVTGGSEGTPGALAFAPVFSLAWAGELRKPMPADPGERDMGASLVDAQQIIEQILVEEEGETTERGAVVLDVTRRGPAARAGLEPADAIVALAGEDVSVTGDVWRILGNRPLGTFVPVTFVRDGQVHTAMLEVSAPALRPWEKKSRPRWPLYSALSRRTSW